VAYELVAAVDLGSNSFRVEIGRIVGNQIYPLDGLKESVRLASGLTRDKLLDGASQLRALEALSRFGERLRGFDPGAVRAVATNTFRVAKNAGQFLTQAEAALGFPIEIISGREEARLIYLGVAHSLPNPQTQQLVIDIGGGSTEFIIGRNFHPQLLESLYMGCISYTLRYFPEGRIDKRRMKEAELAARKEVQAIASAYQSAGWEEAVGSSGTAKAIADLLELNGLNPGRAIGITREGLDRLKNRLIQAGDVARLNLEGLRPDRLPVLPGGIAILSAAFRELGLERMTFSEGALRLGVLYDLLGRYHHEDLREATVGQFMQRYGVDPRQAARVCTTALELLQEIAPTSAGNDDDARRFLAWAARLHEIGISIAHASYHKHSAYILENADMPGFSRRDQQRLASIVLAHRGKLERALASLSRESADWQLIFALRTAVLLHRPRADDVAPPVMAQALPRGFQLTMEASWLAQSPLTAAALDEEVSNWAALGFELRLRRRRDVPSL
jgi:exopolyphosphatase/guanosine-5'-triphosphate,3'-diphosphate pyrophosphatase